MYRALDLMIKEFGDVKYLMAEIGVREGSTSEVLMRYMAKVHPKVKEWMSTPSEEGFRIIRIPDFPLYHYWGVDSLRDRVMPNWETEECTFIEGLSGAKETLERIPEDLHWCFIDCCHCYEHVSEDIQNYSKKIRAGGFLAFHDTSPYEQGTCPQHLKYPEGDGRNAADVTGPGIGVLEALSHWMMLDPEANKFKLVMEGSPILPCLWAFPGVLYVQDQVQESKFGFRVYQRVK